jgi:ribonuclease HI
MTPTSITLPAVALWRILTAAPVEIPVPRDTGLFSKHEVAHPIAELSEFLGRQTNNYAEYSALLATLSYTLRHGFKASKILSDSELLVKQINGEYKVSNPTLKILHGQAMKMRVQLDYFEIKHARREHNRDADRLANLAMDRGIAKKAPVITAKDLGGVASLVPNIQGVVRNGVIVFLSDPLPEGTMVRIDPAQPRTKQ